MTTLTWKEYWCDKPALKKFASIVGVLLSVFQLYTALFGSLDALMQRSIHLGLGLLLVFLVYDAKGTTRGKKSRFDVIPLIAVFFTIGYVLWNYEWITVERYSLISPLAWYEKVLGVVCILLVLEAARRVVSSGLLYVAVAFIFYPFIAPFLPGLLRAAPTDWTAIIDFNFLSMGGIFGIPLGVSATEIALFIIFGSILLRCGGTTLISNIAFAFAGRTTGGPAKVAVVGSTLFGMISGTATGNVATIGSVTIPMMKKAGYHANFAAAVEAAASTGGQIMPPVMGAAAFVMSAFSGIPYSTILKYAIFPAILFYMSLFFIIDLEARKLKLQPVFADITVRETIKQYGHMIIPIIALIYMLVAGFTPRLAGGIGCVSALVAAQFRKSTRMSLPVVLAALEDGAVRMLIVMIACATAGIIVGTVDMTGLGHRLGSAFIYLAHGHLLLGLILGCLVAFILGMGLPTTPAYIIQAATVIPALIGLGLSMPAAHLFAFYFSCLAMITPPDASAAFTAAAIADADAWKTGWTATRLALVAFIVPFMFAYDPGLLLMGSTMSIILSVVTAIIGVFCLAVSISGYFRRTLGVVERAIAFMAAIALIAPGLIMASIGVCLIIILALFQLKGRKTAIDMASK
ncbi:MAG: TRAP transporter fused permease subunit [Syntrophaceae bacterium]